MTRPTPCLPPYEAVIADLEQMRTDRMVRLIQRRAAERAAVCVRLLIDERNQLRQQLSRLSPR